MEKVRYFGISRKLKRFPKFRNIQNLFFSRNYRCGHLFPRKNRRKYFWSLWAENTPMCPVPWEYSGFSFLRARGTSPHTIKLRMPLASRWNFALKNESRTKVSQLHFSSKIFGKKCLRRQFHQKKGFCIFENFKNRSSCRKKKQNIGLFPCSLQRLHVEYLTWKSTGNGKWIFVRQTPDFQLAQLTTLENCAIANKLGK